MSPLGVAAVLFAIELLTTGSSEFAIFSALEVAAFMAIGGFAVAFVFGSFGNVAMILRNRIALRDYMLLGVALGFVAVSALMFALICFEEGARDLGRAGLGEIVELLVASALLGGLNAGLFWVIVRPDRLMRHSASP